MRATEARTLTWAQLSEGWVTFIAKGRQERILPLHPHTAAALTAWSSATDDPRWVFPSPLRRDRPVSEHTFRARFRDLGDRAGIEGLHPHACRHTLATSMVEAGIDVRTLQEVLGHASLRTTQRYVTVRPAQIVKAIGAINYAA